MSWQDDIMAEQDQADALNYMGEAEWRDLYGDDEEEKKQTIKGYRGERIKRPKKNNMV